MDKFSDRGDTGNGRRRRRMIPDDPEDVPDKQSSWIDDRYSLMSQIFLNLSPLIVRKMKMKNKIPEMRG